MRKKHSIARLAHKFNAETTCAYERTVIVKQMRRRYGLTTKEIASCLGRRPSSISLYVDVALRLKSRPKKAGSLSLTDLRRLVDTKPSRRTGKKAHATCRTAQVTRTVSKAAPVTLRKSSPPKSKHSGPKESHTAEVQKRLSITRAMQAFRDSHPLIDKWQGHVKLSRRDKKSGTSKAAAEDFEKICKRMGFAQKCMPKVVGDNAIGLSFTSCKPSSRAPWMLSTHATGNGIRQARMHLEPDLIVHGPDRRQEREENCFSNEDIYLKSPEIYDEQRKYIRNALDFCRVPFEDVSAIQELSEIYFLRESLSHLEFAWDIPCGEFDAATVKLAIEDAAREGHPTWNRFN